MCACVRAYVRVCVRACVSLFVCVSLATNMHLYGIILCKHSPRQAAHASAPNHKRRGKLATTMEVRVSTMTTTTTRASNFTRLSTCANLASACVPYFLMVCIVVLSHTAQDTSIEREMRVRSKTELCGRKAILKLVKDRALWM